MDLFYRSLKPLFVGAFLAVLCGGAWFYHVQEQRVRFSVKDDLASIARLKADRIAEWRDDQLADAGLLSKNPLFLQEAVPLLNDPLAEPAPSLVEFLAFFKENNDISDIVLMGLGGERRLRLGTSLSCHFEHIKEVAALAVQKRCPVFVDFHVAGESSAPHVSVVIPVFENGNGNSRHLGYAVLVSDPQRYLYALIRSWPMPSETAESLLVRRDGDSVLFLNELRHRADTALKLRIPLTQTDVPAVMAVLGKQGVVEGKDYRGVEVISAIVPVANSPWYLVAKADVVEAYASWRFRAALILGALAASLGMLAAASLVVSQREKKAHYRRLYRAEAARRASEERYGITLKSIGDAVIATDAKGRIEFVNPVAEALTGWTEEDARGKPLSEVFRIINELSRAEVENPVERVLRDGFVVALANHTLLIARDGTERPIADSGAPIHAGDGSIIGVVLVFRDQTEERANRRALEREVTRAQQYLDVSGVIMLALNCEGDVVLVNQKGCAVLGATEQEIVGKNWFDQFLPQHVRGEVKAVFVRIMAGGLDMDEYVENHIVNVRGEELLIAWHNTVLRNEAGDIVGTLSSGEDITDRNRAEEALQESEERFHALFEQAPLGYQSLSEDGCFIEVNQAWLETLGYDREEVLGKWFGDFLAPEYVEAFRQRFPLFKAAGSIHSEFEMIHKNGERRFIAFEGRIGHRLDGSFRQTHCILADITEKKRTEEALRIQHELAVALGRTMSLNEGLKLCLTAAIRISRMDCGGAYLVEGEGLKLAVHEGLSEEFVASAAHLGPDTPNVQLVRAGRPVYSNYSHLSSDSQKLHKGLRALALVPIVNEGRAMACLNIASHNHEDVPEEVRPLLEGVTAQAGSFIARALLYEELLESEKKHRALVEGIPDIVMRFDREGRHLFVSDNVEQVVNMPSSRFLGRTHRELGFPEPMCAFWEESIQRAFDSGEAFETEFSYEGRRGVVVFNWRLIPESSPSGKLQTVLSIARDVTAHRKVESDYRTLFREMLDGFAVHEIIRDAFGHPVDYRFLAVNPAFEKMTGLSATDVIGKTVLEVMPGTESNWIETYGRVALTGEPAFFEDYSADLNKYFEVTAFRPAPGQFACIFMDVTERKVAEEAVRQSEEKLRLAMDAASDGVWDWRIPTNEVYYSPGWARILGLEEVLPDLSTWQSRLHPEDRPSVTESLNQHMAGINSRWEKEHRLRTGSGEWKWVLGRGTVVARDANGKPLRMVGTMTDISERKQAELQMAEQLDELRRWHGVMLGRETRVLDLKREVNELLTALGKPQRYTSVETTTQTDDPDNHSPRSSDKG